jgi:hypothetical protein
MGAIKKRWPHERILQTAPTNNDNNNNDAASSVTGGSDKSNENEERDFRVFKLK